MAPVMRKPAAPRRLRQAIALVPGRVMRIAAGDLHHVDAEPIEKLFQLGHALDLQRPAAHADGQRFDCHDIALR